MQDIARHFITRRLGRGVIKTRISSDGGASIKLNFEISDIEKQKIILLVPPDFVRAFNLAGEALLYRLSRQAISQCQRQVLDAKFDNTPITLDCSILPWNGDLTMLPYTVLPQVVVCLRLHKQILSFDVGRYPICLVKEIDIAVALPL
jgi:hypothetical protein